MVTKQRILTPEVGSILKCLMDAQQRGERITSVCPHVAHEGELQEHPVKVTGYIVIVDETEESRRKALEDDNCGW